MVSIISDIKHNINYFFYKSFKLKTVNDFKLTNPKIFNLSETFDLLFFNKSKNKNLQKINIENFIEKYKESKYNKFSELMIRDFGKDDLAKSFYKFLRYDISDKNMSEVLDIFLYQNETLAVNFEKICTTINYLLHKKQNYCFQNADDYLVTIMKFGNNRFIISFSKSVMNIDSLGLNGTYNKIENRIRNKNRIKNLNNEQ